MAPTTKKAKARHSGRDKRSGLRPGDGRRNSTERSAGAVGGDEKKARRAKTKDGEPSSNQLDQTARNLTTCRYREANVS